MSDPITIQELSADFWSWRAAQQPRSGDDIPRIERPDNWTPRWSASDVERYRVELAAFESSLASIFNLADLQSTDSPSGWIDKALIHSALSRVKWELDY